MCVTPAKAALPPFAGLADIPIVQTSICETTAGINAYSGYVTLPKSLLPDAQGWRDDQAAHLFFWYFGKAYGKLAHSDYHRTRVTGGVEARNDPENAPTSLYLGGGPGTSSFDGMSNFPCFINADSNSTTLNQHSWNNHVNMLYVDQPVLTGFSYVTLQHVTLNFVTNEVTPVVAGVDVPELNVTVRQATLDSGNSATVPNNTMTAMRTLWAFSQVWFNEYAGSEARSWRLLMIAQISRATYLK